MPVSVTDPRSSPSDQIAHAAKTIGRSLVRRKVFEAIYRGKKKVKSVTEIMSATGLDRKTVLTGGKALAGNQIVRQTKVDGETGYEKDEFYVQHKPKILRLAASPEELGRFPTKSNPQPTKATVIRISAPQQLVKTRLVTIDDIESFANVKKVLAPSPAPAPPSERTFKAGVQAVIGQTGKFADWGGEGNDLMTTRVRMHGHRMGCAFAFKGPGTKGLLTPAKLGKNGDQIQRLFASEGTLFVVQYHGQIAESVLEQMRVFAQAKSLATGEEILYGVIDGSDSSRLIAAYPKAFAPWTRKRAMRKRGQSGGGRA